MIGAVEPLLSLQGVCFSYPGRQARVLDDVCLELRPGEAVLLTGPTGCGKSTLLKTLNGIIPLESSGTMDGLVLVDGLDTKTSSTSRLAQKVGLVFQSPEDQLFCGNVGDEIAFGPQNLGLAADEVEHRVKQALDQVGMARLARQSIAALSGGQKQRVAIASQLAMQPSILALDEPISQLDPAGSAEVLAVLKRLSQGGMAVLLVEHRIGEVLDLTQRVLVMDHGRLVCQFATSKLPEHAPLMQELGLQIPDEVRLAAFLGQNLGDDLLGPLAAAGQPDPMPRPGATSGGSLLEMREVSFTYPGSANPALQNISLTVGPGEVVGLMGPNGSGKSTLLSILAGLNRPCKGQVHLAGRPLPKRPNRSFWGRVALVFQNPDLLLIESSVRRELLSGPRNLRQPVDAQAVGRLARGLELTGYLDMPPWSLSKGQRLRVALAALLAMQPQVLLLDEPTTGQNRLNIQRLLDVLSRRYQERATIICSHDLDTVCRFAQHLVILDQGRILAQGPIRELAADTGLLRQAGLRPTLSLELSQRLNRKPPWLTCGEVINSLPCRQPREAVAP
jgi:energy-coupling factor transport system ATP-binding protein